MREEKKNLCLLLQQVVGKSFIHKIVWTRRGEELGEGAIEAFV